MSHCISSIVLPYILHGTVRGVVSLVAIPAQLMLVMMVAHRQVVLEESVYSLPLEADISDSIIVT